jgi:hypothetical protein
MDIITTTIQIPKKYQNEKYDFEINEINGYITFYNEKNLDENLRKFKKATKIVNKILSLIEIEKNNPDCNDEHYYEIKISNSIVNIIEFKLFNYGYDFYYDNKIVSVHKIKK